MSPQTIAASAIAVICFAAGWVTEGWRKDTEISDLKTTQAAAESRDVQAAIGRLTTANKRADELQNRLAAAQVTIDLLAEEKSLATRQLTVGRRCLDGAAVRMLNNTASLEPAAVPAAAGESLRADAAFATDTDVGLWVIQCQRGYKTCSGRLDAIADFYGEKE
jgi:hypothetical protein